MAVRWMKSMGAAMALSGVISASAAGQTIAYGEPPPRSTTALEETYQLRLRSAWPQLRQEGCRNGGEEVVEGLLTRTGARSYAGSFTRHTRILFCGPHGGGAEAEACELILEGSGTVAMRAVVLDDERSPTGRTVRAAWDPAASHGVTVSGACANGFKEGMEQMYLSVRHGAEFALPAVGSASSERLEDYAWIVEIE